MTNIDISYETILEIISVILIEIRSHDNPTYSSTMADVVHHAPGMIAKGMAPDVIYEDMFQIASRHGVADYLENLLNRIKLEN